jgi:hypothetical protein
MLESEIPFNGRLGIMLITSVLSSLLVFFFSFYKAITTFFIKSIALQERMADSLSWLPDMQAAFSGCTVTHTVQFAR